MDDRYTQPQYDRAERRSGFDLNHPTIVALLHLVGIVTGGLLNIVALVLAYSWKDDPRQEPWMRSHHRFHIRTFWYALVLALLGTVTAIIGVGFLILALIGVYVALRAIVSLMAAQRRDPMPNPEAFLW